MSQTDSFVQRSRIAINCSNSTRKILFGRECFGSSQFASNDKNKLLLLVNFEYLGRYLQDKQKLLEQQFLEDTICNIVD
jgi:hypothetical protein